MFNARRSALYLAIIGAGFMAGEASAIVCVPPQVKTASKVAGYVVYTCNIVGSDDITAAISPFDGGEFNPPGPALVNPVMVQASVQGAVYPSFEFLAPSFALSSLANTNSKKPKPPKNASCFVYLPTDADDDHDGKKDEVKKVKVPCPDPQPFDPENQSLTDSNGDPVDTLFSTTVKANCKGTGLGQECVTTLKVTSVDANGASLGCPVPPNPPGSKAVNATPIPPFVQIVTATDKNGVTVSGYQGCYGFLTGDEFTPGSLYACEGIDSLTLDEFNCGSGGYIGFGTGPEFNAYCTTPGVLPDLVLYCSGSV